MKDGASDQVKSETASSADKAPKSVRLFHDDTFKGFFRRLHWSNDGKECIMCVISRDEDPVLAK